MGASGRSTHNLNLGFLLNWRRWRRAGKLRRLSQVLIMYKFTNCQ